MNPGLRLAYLSRILPALSETFVVREIAALRRLGVEVVPLSLHPGDATVVHPEIPDLAAETKILISPRQPLFWLAHLRFAILSPRRYFGCLWRYVLSLRDRRWRAALFFAVAPYAALTCRRARVQHIHAHFANTAASVALMAATLAGISFSFTAHAFDIFIDNLLLPSKLVAASFIACISQYNVRFLREHYPEAHQANLVVVRNGLDITKFHPAWHPPGEPPCIVAVGRLVETKGFHTLVEACGRLRDQGLLCRCLIIGAGPEAVRLENMIKDLDLSDRIILKGALPPNECLAAIRQADVLAMPSCMRQQDADGIPTVLIEAMAMEIPVVATRVSGIPELVLTDQTGLLVEPEDPKALAAALSRLLKDRPLAQRLAQAGRAKVVKEFDGNLTARQLQHLFQEVVLPGSANSKD